MDSGSGFTYKSRFARRAGGAARKGRFGTKAMKLDCLSSQLTKGNHP